ncbi:MAG: hypothetical protein A3H71_02100 [Candidatus Sungbacteria bacterium RIFCSPLOWO2_02_FULL_48_13b]|uniref:Uncharacterized protein n=1 Tax=Candidatus Sungbacteria bacterium RIFCSPLOWO2_02_FULL_48_13b TaxID=1802283 RepID=A0A1G2LFH2_9BACT|nr:MAG: hypothetical protein A3H71_02100 [Candidatus Sungbacteria bacterium RIFCSPLOWO2_02_FULL_48_13b]
MRESLREAIARFTEPSQERVAGRLVVHGAQAPCLSQLGRINNLKMGAEAVLRFWETDMRSIDTPIALDPLIAKSLFPPVRNETRFKERRITPFARIDAQRRGLERETAFFVLVPDRGKLKIALIAFPSVKLAQKELIQLLNKIPHRPLKLANGHSGATSFIWMRAV